MKSLHRFAFASLASSVVGLGLLPLGQASGVASDPPDPKSPQRDDRGGDVVARVGLDEIDRVPEERWAALRTRRIYFAHQSVGSNMMRGVTEILRARPTIALATRRIATSSESAKSDAQGAFDTPGLVHGPAGPNGDPRAKFEAFEQFVVGPGGEAIEIAFVKLCYADIDGSTNAQSLFDRYVAMIERIKRARPTLRVLHATVPLKAADQGAKGAVKRLVGNGTGPANAVRGRYNDLLRARFPASQIIDIAAVESRALDGSAATSSVSGVAWPALCSEYTSDGGHLNDIGQVVVARALLLKLAENAESVPSSLQRKDGDVRVGAEGRTRRGT
ncbi:MAG: hypothetical protein RL591_1609 [Planctomycetota bacterium]|jgi:hypothetical protein